MRKLLLTLWLCLLPALAGAQNVLGPTANSIPIAITTNGTTQLVAAPTITAPGGQLQAVYVTGFNIIAAGTTSVQFVYGTGTNCGTGQGNLTGNYSLTAQVGLVYGDGSGITLIAPRGNAVCIVSSGSSVGVAGAFSYAVF